MKTADNRFMVIAQILRGATKDIDAQMKVSWPTTRNSLNVILEVAKQLEEIAAEGPSDGEMLEWVVENLIEKRSVMGGGVAVHWVDGDGEGQWTKGKDTRDAIRNAMHAAAIEPASEVTT